ncbi:histidine kinase [uncultured Algoriphagus sp.]|uniref:sensor histidine kinase n=1 Tax=uncultured Algoriphagus sp. TaxID=417365 RepID=UPI0030ED1C2E|tara:strand:+ start:36833 stop:37888 length:1056 start_codon:yes stop_codon:yes gene_type:complete
MSKNIKPFRSEVSIHILIWIVLLALPSVFFSNSGWSWRDLFINPWYHLQLLVLAGLFYTNYLKLVDQWLFKGYKIKFWVVNVLLVGFIVVLKFDVLMPFLFPERAMEIIPKEAPPMEFVKLIDFLINIVPVVFAIGILSSREVAQVRLLEKEAMNTKLQSDLNYLKYQLQPHFFFNSLNNIYSLVDLDPDKAKESIHSLSKLMRYLLKSSEREFVSLKGEIDFLEKYIELMEIRLQENVKVQVTFPPDIPDIKLPPLLFISIVENAFKHGVSAKAESYIFFDLKIDYGHVFFEARNSNFAKNQQDLSGSGIGIENLRKRLFLLYGDHFTYFNGVENDQYVARLMLKIDLEQ